MIAKAALLIFAVKTQSDRTFRWDERKKNNDCRLFVFTTMTAFFDTQSMINIGSFN